MSQKGKQAILESGALTQLVVNTLEASEKRLDSYGGGVWNDEKQVALGLLTDVWKLKPELVQNKQGSNPVD